MQAFLRMANRALLRTVPKNRAGDYLLSLLHFYRRQKRFPSDISLLNSYLFKKKTSWEAYDPLRHYVSDKEYLKSYVREKVGAAYNVPTLAVLRKTVEVDDYSFPNSCCIKPTHASGMVVIRRDGEHIDKDEIKRWFSINYYEYWREINYRYLRPKLIVEPLVFERSNIEDFKIFCFKGAPKLIQVDVGRHFDHTRLYFDREWTEMDFSINYRKSHEKIERPKSLELMLEIATKLSKDFEFIRVDLYTDGEAVLVGELTNWPENANGIFIPREAECQASKTIFGD